MKFVIHPPFLYAYRIAKSTGLLEWEPIKILVEKVYFFYKRYLEAPGFKFLQPFVKPDTWVVDVGANIGYFTSMAVKWVEGNVSVIAIEPEPENLGRLHKRVTRLGIEKTVDIISAAATDREGFCRLVLNRNHPGDHRLGARGLKVRALKLDSLMDKSDEIEFSLIKIDVQGAEMSVLRGAKELLHRDHPTLLIEIDDAALRQFGSSAAELMAFLVDFGYTPYQVTSIGISPLPTNERLVIGETRYQDILFRWNGANVK